MNIRELVLEEWAPRLVREAVTGDLRAQAALVQVAAAIGPSMGITRGDMHKTLRKAVEKAIEDRLLP